MAICGGGASAVLLLESLARTSGRRIIVEVIEPRAQLARGVAYSTECPLHLLNVPVGRMSSADDSTSFLRWLQEAPGRSARHWGADDFAPRERYGRYLEWLLERVSASPNIDFTWHRTAALQLTRAPSEWRIERMWLCLRPEPPLRHCSANTCQDLRASWSSRTPGTPGRSIASRRMRRCCSPARA